MKKVYIEIIDEDKNVVHVIEKEVDDYNYLSISYYDEFVEWLWS